MGARSPSRSAPSPLLGCRELQVAVAEEDYRLAATLRDKVQQLTEELPSRKRLLLSMLDHLQDAEYEDKAGALRVIGEQTTALHTAVCAQAAVMQLQPAAASAADLI